MGDGKRRGRSELLVLVMGRRDVAVFGGASRGPAGGSSGGKLDGGRGDGTTDGRVEDGTTDGRVEDQGVSMDDVSRGNAWVSP